jgi:hypothetical protein
MLNAAIRVNREAGHCSISGFRYAPSLRAKSRDRDVRIAYHFAPDGTVPVCAFGGIKGAHECLKEMAGDELVGPVLSA